MWMVLAVDFVEALQYNPIVQWMLSLGQQLSSNPKYVLGHNFNFPDAMGTNFWNNFDIGDMANIYSEWYRDHQFGYDSALHYDEYIYCNLLYCSIAAIGVFHPSTTMGQLQNFNPWICELPW